MMTAKCQTDDFSKMPSSPQVDISIFNRIFKLLLVFVDKILFCYVSWFLSLSFLHLIFRLLEPENLRKVWWFSATNLCEIAMVMFRLTWVLDPFCNYAERRKRPLTLRSLYRHMDRGGFYSCIVVNYWRVFKA